MSEDCILCKDANRYDKHNKKSPDCKYYSLPHKTTQVECPYCTECWLELPITLGVAQSEGVTCGACGYTLTEATKNLLDNLEKKKDKRIGELKLKVCALEEEKYKCEQTISYLVGVLGRDCSTNEVKQALIKGSYEVRELLRKLPYDGPWEDEDQPKRKPK